jgi:ethanolaminephosphotransferase
MIAEYIPPEGLDALAAYKYKSGEYSWLDLRLNGFWFACAELLPRWVAPNLVTLAGTVHLVLIAVLAAVYDPELLGAAPRWVYLLNAWCVWVYQTMDAVDGKQARRTGSSSPLGQLFDHGCDGLGTTLIAMGIISLMGFGNSVEGALVLATVQVPFFLCQWEENHCHVLRAQVGNFGVTEGQYLTIGLNLVTAAAGVGFWKQTVASLLAQLGLAGAAASLPPLLLGAQLRQVSVLIGGFFPALLALTAVINVLRKPGVNVARAALLVLPLVLQQGLQVALQARAPSVLNANLVPLIVGLGLLGSHLSNRIIIASVCHLPIPAYQRVLYPVPLLLLAILTLGGGGGVALAEKQADRLLGALMLAYCVLVAVQYTHFVVSVTVAITTRLGIRTFVIKVDKTQ